MNGNYCLLDKYISNNYKKHNSLTHTKKTNKYIGIN